MNKRFTSKLAVLPLLVMVTVLSCSILPADRRLTWTLTLELDGQGDEQNAVEQTIAIIKRRLDLVYLPRHKLERQGNSRILVSLPDVADRERLMQFITSRGKLELVHVISPPSPHPAETYETKEAAVASLGSTLPPNRRVLTYLLERDFAERTEGGIREQKKWVVVESPAVVTGSDLRSAEAIQSLAGPDDYNILFSLNPSGAERFGAWTGANINQYLAVVLNDEVRSIACIRSQIFDQGEITGRFTKESAEDLAHILISGALPAPVKIISEAPIK